MGAVVGSAVRTVLSRGPLFSATCKPYPSQRGSSKSSTVRDSAGLEAGFNAS